MYRRKKERSRLTPRSYVFVAFLILFGGSVFFWRHFTARFLRENGKNADFVIPTFYISMTRDFVRAVIVARSSSVSLPFGIYMHGVLFVSWIGLLLVASRWALFEVWD